VRPVALHHVGVLAAHDVEHGADLGRIVLEVRIQHRDQPPPRGAKAGVKRRGLPVAAPWRRSLHRNAPEPGARRHERLDGSPRRIRRAVVDDHELVRETEPADSALDLVHQPRDVLLLVVRGRDDGQLRIGAAGRHGG
jgi:hypothetical protein